MTCHACGKRPAGWTAAVRGGQFWLAERRDGGAYCEPCAWALADAANASAESDSIELERRRRE